jgi:hypothetical protein
MIVSRIHIIDTYVIGRNIFEPDAGTCDSMVCKVCGEKCDIQRNLGPAYGFAAAMAGHTRNYDRFTCPRSEEKWHREALVLAAEMDDLCSPTLKSIVAQDLANLVSKHR